MNAIRPLFAASLLVGSAFAHAGEVQPYHAKNRSQFAVQANAHDPFWPVGYVHQDLPLGKQAKPLLELKREQFDLSSISLAGRERLAVINQKVFGVGELVTVQTGGQKTAVQIVAIGDGAVVLQYQEQRIEIPLRRENLAKLTPSANDAPPTPAVSLPLPVH